MGIPFQVQTLMLFRSSRPLGGSKPQIVCSYCSHKPGLLCSLHDHHVDLHQLDHHSLLRLHHRDSQACSIFCLGSFGRSTSALRKMFLTFSQIQFNFIVGQQLHQNSARIPINECFFLLISFNTWRWFKSVAEVEILLIC